MSMKMLLKVEFPPQKFNAAIRDGSAVGKLGRIMEKIKPEASFFTADHGKRGGFLVINLENPSQIPFFAEPFFLYFDAHVEVLPFMTAEDLVQAHLEDMNEIWPE